MQQLRIALEWYLNPDHLPLLAARERLRDQGLAVELVVPDDHYDGFDALAEGGVELVVNEPLHLVERRDLPLAAHGCFFATDGGVLMQRSALGKLLAGAPVRIASPVSVPTTDQLCRDIVAGWLAQQPGAPDRADVIIETAGFAHVDNLAAGFDGAWLAFANVEGVSARLRGLDCVMITTAAAGLPDFSALELIAAADAPADVRRAIALLVDAMNTEIPALQADPDAARRLWHAASGEAGSAESDAIVAATLPRLCAPVRRDAARWRPMWQYMRDHGGDVVDAAAFEAMFA